MLLATSSAQCKTWKRFYHSYSTVVNINLVNTCKWCPRIHFSFTSLTEELSPKKTNFKEINKTRTFKIPVLSRNVVNMSTSRQFDASMHFSAVWRFYALLGSLTLLCTSRQFDASIRFVLEMQMFIVALRVNTRINSYSRALERTDVGHFLVWFHTLICRSMTGPFKSHTLYF